MSGKKREIEVGPLQSEETGLISIDEGGKIPFHLLLYLTDEETQMLFQTAESLTFKIVVRGIGKSIPVQGIKFLGWSELLGFLQEGTYFVKGKVNGIDNIQNFQVGSDRWQDCFLKLKMGASYKRTIFVKDTNKSDVKDLIAILIKAERQLIEGKPKDALGEIRNIPERLGYKPKAQPNRYVALSTFSLGDKDREEIHFLLDFLWAWTSKGHHNSHVIPEERAEIAIDTGYSLVGYLSKVGRQQVVNGEEDAGE